MAQHNNYPSKLVGARVLVFGGSSGIGFGVAKAVIEHGGSVIISSSSQERVDQAVDRLRTTYPDVNDRILGFPCNLATQETLESEIAGLFAQVSRVGTLNHVVFTAGDTLPVKKLEDFSLKDIQQAGMVRFFSPLIVAQHLSKQLELSPASSFTLTTGGVPEHLMKDWAVIQAYLAGMNGMARGLAVDLAPIRVNAVGLGVVETEMWDASKDAGVYDGVAAAFTAKMTTGAVAKVEDVVECYLYLMKDKNISGSTVNSHGGMLLL